MLKICHDNDLVPGTHENDNVLSQEGRHPGNDLSVRVGCSPFRSLALLSCVPALLCGLA